MFLNTSNRTFRAASTAGALVGAFLLASTSAQAGECPADKVGVDVTKPGAMKPKDVKDDLLAAIDLSKEKLNLSNHRLRIRKLVVQPGGIVPWHSHGDRPALIYVVSGSIHEYASTCAVPIEHKAGEVSRETGAISHWWKNNGKSPAVLLSADIIHDKEDQHVM
jgi:quercetin dioxygenase-like cupin family protein